MNAKSALNSFGLLCRHFRIRSGFTIADQALALNMSVADISSIETDRSSITVGYVDAFAYWLELTPEERNHLEELTLKPKKTIDFPNLTAKQAELLMKIFRRVHTFNPALIRGLDAYLKAVVYGERQTKPNRLPRSRKI